MRKIYNLLILMLMVCSAHNLYAAKAIFFVDDSSQMTLFQRGDILMDVTDVLIDGEYVCLEFEPGQTWNLASPRGITFPQLIKNGEVTAQNFTPKFNVGFDFEVEDGDIVEIYVKAPKSKDMATIKVEYNQDAIGSLRKITINDKKVEADCEVFRAEKGAEIAVYVGDVYSEISLVSLGDQELQYNDSIDAYVGNIEGDAILRIEAQLIPLRSVNLNINNPNAIKVYQNFSNFGLGVDIEEVGVDFKGIKEGNIIIKQLVPHTTTIQVEPLQGYAFERATYTDANGNVYNMRFNTLCECYYVDIVDEDVVSIEIVAVPFTKYISFGVEVENLSQLESYCINPIEPFELLIGSYDDEKSLKDGLNHYQITQEQASSIELYLWFKEDLDKFKEDLDTYVRIDGIPQKIRTDYEINAVYCNFSIEDGQILTIGPTDRAPKN